MIYLSGAPVVGMMELVLEGKRNLGLMAAPRGYGGNALLDAGIPWAADNGCYTAGEKFDADKWVLWLEKQRRWQATCLFAVAPDVVGDAQATFLRSMLHLEAIAALGYRPAFVTQDGCRSDLVPWDEIGCLFVGGTNAWKLSESSYALIAEARRRGKWTHMGRVNGLRRMKAGHASLIDSVDGTELAFGPAKHLPHVLQWLDWCASQPALLSW